MVKRKETAEERIYNGRVVSWKIDTIDDSALMELVTENVRLNRKRIRRVALSFSNEHDAWEFARDVKGKMLRISIE